MRDELVEMILELARELAREESWMIDDLAAQTVLFGEDGVLDSMGLVSLVIATEQAIEEKYDKSISLADEKAMSQSKSPYRSVESLAEYASTQLEGA